MRVAYVAVGLFASLVLSVGVPSGPASAGCYNNCDGAPPVYQERAPETY